MTPLYDDNGKHWNNGFKFHCEVCKQERHLNDLHGKVEYKVDEGASRYYGEEIWYKHHANVCCECEPVEEILEIRYARPHRKHAKVAR